MEALNKYIEEGLLRNRVGGKGLTDEIKKDIIENCFICLGSNHEDKSLPERNYKFTDNGLELNNEGMRTTIIIFIIAPQNIISSLNITKLTGVQLNIGRLWNNNSKNITSLEGLFSPNFTADDYSAIRLNNLSIKNLKGLPEMRKWYHGTNELTIKQCNDITSYKDIPDTYRSVAIYLDKNKYTYDDANKLQEELDKKGKLTFVQLMKF